MTVLIIFIALVAMICLNVPIAVALAISAILGLLITEGVGSLVTVALDMYDGSTKFSLIAIPMFVLAGAIMNAGGITDRLINFVSALIGFVRGGLGMVNIGVSLFFAEISGSAVADVAALGSIMIPQMKRRGYSAPLAAAITSSSASLAIIIPPSIPMIVYAVSANTSVEQLFVAGIVPGLLGAAGLMSVAYAFARRYNLPVEEAFNLAQVRRTFVDALPAFTLPVIILGGIYSGIVTVTEAAGIAAFSAIMISLIFYKGCSLREVPEVMAQSVKMTAIIFFIILGALALGHWITSAGIADRLVEFVEVNDLKAWQFLILINLLMLVLGMFLETLAVILITVPIVLPLLAPLGIHPIHYAVIVTVNMELALLTPPIGLNVYVLSSITGARVETVTRGVMPFVLIMLILLAMVTFIPQLSLFLPQLVYGN